MCLPPKEAIKADPEFATGPCNMLQYSLQKGEIQIVFPEIIADPFCYYTLTPTGIQKSAAHHAFESWLFSQGNTVR